MTTRVGNGQLVLFALPALVSTVLHGPILGILPSLYAAEFAIDLTVIGVVLLAARLFDAVTDPLIGFLSDRTVSHHGKRKPWIVAGSALTVISIYFLFSPGDHSTAVYFLSFSILLYFAWTVMEIPYAAWVLELSRDTKQRARINAFRTAAMYIGGILFTSAPVLVPSAQGQMNFDVLGVIAIGAVVAVPLTTYLAVAHVPQGDVYKDNTQPKLSELWKSLTNNKPFLFFVLMYLFIGLAGGFGNVLSFMYMDTYLEIGHKYTQVFLPTVVLAPLSLPFWVWTLNKYGKYRMTPIAFSIYLLFMPLPWFIEPGPAAILPMTIFYAAQGLFMPLLMVAMPTILGDIIDLDELKTGKNRAGQFYAFNVLIAKGTAAVGGPLALLLVGLAGYQPGAETNDATAILGLRVVNILIPPLIALPGIMLLWFFPLTDARQKEIKIDLEAQAATA